MLISYLTMMAKAAQSLNELSEKTRAVHHESRIKKQDKRDID